MNEVAMGGMVLGPRPMSFGQILERIWTILRWNWGLFLGLGAVPMGGLIVLEGGLFGAIALAGLFPPHEPVGGVPAMMPVPALLRLVGGIVAVSFACLVLLAVYMAAACLAGIEAHRGQKITFREAFGRAFQRTGRYVWLVILQSLIIMAPILLIVAILALAVSKWMWGHGEADPGVFFLLFPVTLLLYLGAMVYAVWMSLKLGLSFPASVAEDLPASDALARSCQLTRKAKGRMFLVLLVVYAISYGAMLVVELVCFVLAAIGMFVSEAMQGHGGGAAGVVGITVVGVGFGALFFVAMTLMYGAYAISLAVLYEDQRVRIDGAAAGQLGPV
jgi:membrane-anchored glycerophosphoryl diester phosphodiesterase (GDPDase)